MHLKIAVVRDLGNTQQEAMVHATGYAYKRWYKGIQEMRGSHTGTQDGVARLEGLIPAIENWHTKMRAMKVYATFIL